jgi:putative acetyltransferase
LPRRRRSAARLWSNCSPNSTGSSLETGSTKEFAPAQNLYAGFGFRRCGPFADYGEDPFSLYMTKEL